MENNAASARSEALVIIGAGGHGSEVAAYAQELALGQAIELMGFVDDHKPRGGWRGTPILGDLTDLEALVAGSPDRVWRFLTAVGDNGVRKQIVQRIENLKVRGLQPWTLRHPTACIGPDVTVKEGACLAPHCIITAHASIGRHSILNVLASVSHDCAIGDYVNLNPGCIICGNVNLGEGCYIGAGATIIDGVSVGPWSVIGAGAVVVEDIPRHVTAVGVPARVIKRHSKNQVS